MKLTREQVQHNAQLARLTLSEEEEALYQEQLSAILEYFEQLQALDTEAIPPTTAVSTQRNVMRDDTARPSLSPEEILSNAPADDRGSFKVPGVLE